MDYSKKEKCPKCNSDMIVILGREQNKDYVWKQYYCEYCNYESEWTKEK